MKTDGVRDAGSEMSICFDIGGRVTDTGLATPMSAARRVRDRRREKTAPEGSETMPEHYARSSRAENCLGAADDLIESVVSLVAEKNRRGADPVDSEIVTRLSVAARSLDPGDLRRLVLSLLDGRLSRTALIDTYIPAVARQLGDFWCDDAVSFSDVTIGTARLQAVLSEFRLPKDEPLDAPQIALAVRHEERHTLGAVVAANQFRRLGAGVQLVLGRSDAEIAAVLAGRDFDAVMISSGGSESLASLRILVDKIRTLFAGPIVLGGTILDQSVDHCAVIGVDHVTTDPKEALRLCGLKTPLRGASRSGKPE